MEFKDFNLDKKIIEALDIIGYKEATKVQESTMLQILSGKDVVIFEKTGMGKTAAFTVPLCEKIDWNINSPQVLVIAPTRELAIQIAKEAESIGRLKKIKTQSVYGKQSFEKEKINLKQRCHFVAATLGRLRDHIEKGTINLDNVKYVVMDEFDELIKTGFLDDLDFVMSKLTNVEQKILVSATIPSYLDEVISKYLNEPFVYNHYEHKEQEAFKLREEYALVENDNFEVKFDILMNLIMELEALKIIVFCNTQEMTEKLYTNFRNKLDAVFKIHGGLNQRDRLKALRSFDSYKKTILVATNVVSRGIHVESVDLVLNFEIPTEKEKYIHRIGRTGRAGNEGNAITIVSKSQIDKFMENYSGNSEIVEYKNRKLLGDKESLYKEFAISKENKIADKKKSEDIIKLYFRGGKNKKLRAADFLGVICSIEGITSEDIGTIKVDIDYSTVDILNGKGMFVYKNMSEKTIKGKRIKTEIARR